MIWVKAALALFSLLQAIIALANSRRARGEGAAEAIATIANEAANAIQTAHAARLRARDRDRSGGLHDDADPFRRD